MSSSKDALVDTGGGVILPPYTSDHTSRSHRRVKLLIVVLVSVFCLIYGMSFALFAPYLIVGLIAPLAPITLIVIWALPDTRTAPVRLISPMLFTMMFFLVMWPNYIALALPGLPWITMERITGVPLAITLLVCFSTSQEFRSRSADALRTTPYMWKLFAGFLVIQTLSIGFSHSIFESIDRYFVAQLGWTAVFFASVYVFLKPGRVERMAGMIWLMAIAVGVIATIEWRVQHVLWAGHIPSFLQIGDESVARTLSGANRFGIYRATATFGTPLGLGEYMALTLPLVVRFALGPYSWPLRIAAAVSSVFVVFVAIISGSRVGTLGCIAVVMLYAAEWSAVQWMRNPKGLVGPALATVYPIFGGLFLGSTLFIGHLHNMFWGNGSQKYSDQDRIEQIKLGIPKILSHPWGYGVGMGGRTLDFHPFGTLTIDDYYLLIALEYGVVGFVLYYGMLIAAIVYGGKTIARLRGEFKVREWGFLTAIAISLVAFILIKSSFSEQENHPIAFMMLGMIVALVYRIQGGSELPKPASAPAAAAAPVLPPARRQGAGPRLR